MINQILNPRPERPTEVTTIVVEETAFALGVGIIFD
jgi:hypothetical protein